MIKNITIENYKLFKSFHLKDIPRILLIGGENNCGKTSFLEAVFFILDSLDPLVFIEHLKWRNFLENIVSNDPKFLLEPSFHNFNLNQPITFQYTLCPSSTSFQLEEEIERKISYKFLPSKLSEHKYNNGKQVAHESHNIQTNQPVPLGLIEASYQLEQGNDSKFLFNFHSGGISFTNIEKEKEHLLLEYNLKIPATFLHSSLDPITVCNIYGNLDKMNRTGPILEALQILEPKLKSLSVISISNQPRIYGDIGIGKKIPLSLMGQGMVHLLSILLNIARMKDGIVLIDEMEDGFHHSVLPLTWEVIAKHAEANNVQIMATTHSREMIMGAVKGIPENMRDDFKYMRIDRDKDQFDPKIYDAEMLKSASKMNLAIR